MEILQKKYYFDQQNYNWGQKDGFHFSISDKHFTWIKTGSTGYDILQKLTGEKTLMEVVEEVASEYEIPLEEVRKDVVNFCYDCLNNHVISEKGETFQGKPLDTRLSTIFIDITDECNLNCIYCNKPSNCKGVFVEPEQINEMLSNVSREQPIAGTLINITGGEPLLHSKLSEILRTVYSFGCKIILWTNGTMIDDSMASILKKYCEYIVVSVDHYTEENNDRIRGRGSYRGAVDGVRICVNNNIPVFIAVTPTKYNLSDLDKLLTFAYELGARGVLLNEPIHMTIDNQDLSHHFQYEFSQLRNMTMYMQKKASLINSWKNTSFEFGSKSNIVFFSDTQRCLNNLTVLRSKEYCGAGINEISIDVAGNVYPCHALQAKMHKIGTVEDYGARKVRLLQGQNLQDCPDCLYKIFCLGGCRAAAYFHSKDITGKNPYCEHQKVSYEEIIWSPLQPVTKRSND